MSQKRLVGPARRWRALRRSRDERGAVAVIVAMMLVLLVALAAIGVDIASNVAAKQKLRDTLDLAAHAGASELPGNGHAALTAALNAARSMNGDADPAADLWCVVGATPSGTVNETHIPSSCYPGPPPYTAGHYPGLVCNEFICAIPCTPGEGIQCNTIRVSDTETVPYAFAPAIGYDEGSTGHQIATACKGACGSEMPNPMDVVFMADRTRSMLPHQREAMKSAILETLKTMTPSMHYVAFGTLHKSSSSWGCATSPSTASNPASGDWVPVGYNKDYLQSLDPPVLRSSNSLVRAVDCLPESPQHGTHLAAAFKGAARFLLNTSSAHLGARPGTPKKVLVFETDGMPDEVMNNGYHGLGSGTEIGAGYNGSCQPGTWWTPQYAANGWCNNYQQSSAGLQGCKNLERIATEAKSRGILVITVGFGQAATGQCTVTNKHNRNDPSIPWRTGGEDVKKYLAAAASPHPQTGAPSDAGDCSTPAGRQAENEDGDFFFCATDGPELGPIFKTAIAQVGTGIRFIRLPA